MVKIQQSSWYSTLWKWSCGIILTRLSGGVMFTLFSGQKYQGKNTPYELDNMKTFKELGGF